MINPPNVVSRDTSGSDEQSTVMKVVSIIMFAAVGEIKIIIYNGLSFRILDRVCRKQQTKCEKLCCGDRVGLEHPLEGQAVDRQEHSASEGGRICRIFSLCRENAVARHFRDTLMPTKPTKS
jgi:hypothetical protein